MLYSAQGVLNNRVEKNKELEAKFISDKSPLALIYELLSREARLAAEEDISLLAGQR